MNHHPHMKPTIDTMSVMRAIKVKETFKEWFKTVIKLTLPSSSLISLSIEYVNDVHRDISPKNYSRDKRGQSEIRVHLQSLTFFHDIKNKQHLFSLFVTYLCADNFVQHVRFQYWLNTKMKFFKWNSKFRLNSSTKKPILEWFSIHSADDKCSTLFKRFRYSCIDGLYTLNTINEKWNISELTSQQSFLKFM